MLNRRVLRIKAMQSLFAYYQAKEANYLLAEDLIREKLQPKLNLDVPEDRHEMAKKEAIAVKLYHQFLKQEDNQKEPYSDDEKIAEALQEALAFITKQTKQDEKNIGNKMLLEVEHLYSSYFALLQLLVEFAYLHQDKKSDKFFQNPIIKYLIENKELNQEITKRNINWKNHLDIIKKTNKEHLENTEFLENYISKKTSENADEEIIQNIIKNIIFGETPIQEHLEDNDIYWEENKSILKSMLKKTIKDHASEGLLKISPNWEDDGQFFKDLYKKTIESDAENEHYIEKFLKNWDKERLAFSDKIILKMGITEMLHFPSIPVKVTINEYIDVSKMYSTPKSKQFINGVLDKIYEELKLENKILKSGRGLIDNK